MKRLITVFFSLISGASLLAQNNVIYVNNGGILTAENHGVITSAIPIDATAFLNRGTFTNIFTSEFGYTMSNVRFFTNRGRMTGTVGFHLDHINTAAGTRRPLASFFNDNNASITATDTGLDPDSFFNFFFSPSGGTVSLLKVNATNVVNRGNLSVGNIGLLKLTGKTVDLSRGSVVAGDISNVDTNLDDFLVSFFDLNSYGVEDIYGGAGDQTIDLNPNRIGFNSLGYFPPLGVFSPLHDVQLRSPPGGFGVGGFFLNAFVSLPQTFPAAFEPHTFVTLRPTPRGVDKHFQVVFVKTNFADTNISAAVRFGPSDVTVNPFAQTAVVQFSTPDFDPVTGGIVTNAVYFIDSSAEFGAIFAITNVFGNSSVRPSSYRILTSAPGPWLFGVTNNIPPDLYDPFFIFPGNTYEDDVVDAQYAGYAAKVGRNPELATGLGGFTNFFGLTFGNGFTNLDELILFPDPTNQAGRIEINADTLDMSLARIRAEGLLSLNAKHLKSGGAFDISAGIINADLGSTNGTLIISNVFPSHFKRVRGDIYAYSAIWNNTETNAFETNNNRFHVLILDHNLKADFKPTIRHLALRSTNVVVKDDLSIVKSALFQAENLTFGGTMADGGSNTVTFSEDAIDLRANNLVGVKNFLNESNSIFQGADTAYFGYDTPTGFISFTNRGMLSATAPLFKAARFHNSGTIIANNGGSITIQAGSANLSNGTNLSDGSIEISAGTLIATNSILTAGTPNLLGQPQFGRLDLNVTNLITDFGAGANNFWQVSDGFNLFRRPFQGDLLGTQIRTIASGFNQVQHIWAGVDVGPGPGGFVNNVALDHLILDVQSPTAKLQFTGANFNNALYVRTLDFNVGTNVDINTDFNNLMQIDSNMRIYYINSNAEDKLTNAFPGRVIQVPDFAFAGGKTPLTVRANGLGVIKPNLDGKDLNVGATYELKATPGPGQIFAGWSGGTNSGNPSLAFQMQRGLVLQADFLPNPLDAHKGDYNGLFHETEETGGVRQESSGFVSIKLTQKGMFSGKLLLGKPYPFRGTFNSSGGAEVQISRGKGKTALTLNLQVDLTNGTDQIVGTVASQTEGWVATLLADRANVGLPPVIEKGQYTMVIPGVTNAPSNPAGDGFGFVNVDANGKLRFKGTLADGSQVNQQANISKAGQWPLYASVQGGNASVLSWVTFTNDFSSSFQGELSWIKKAKPGRNYQAGFTNVTLVLGSRYVRPASGTSVLEIINGTVTLSGGNLSEPFTNEVTLGSNNIITVTTGTNQLKLTIALPSGLVNGNFIHPDSKARTSIKGVVLQEQNSARGFFLGTNQSGAIILKSH